MKLSETIHLLTRTIVHRRGIESPNAIQDRKALCQVMRQSTFGQKIAKSFLQE